MGTGTIDLHADTSLHNHPLASDEPPGFWMRVWQCFINFFALFFPKLRNFHRHVDQKGLDTRGRGLQVFSTVSQGLPPFFEASFNAYTGLVGDWPAAANDSAFNAFLFQAAWIHGQVQEHGDRLVLANDLASVTRTIRGDKIAVQIGVEGAFPLTVHPDDLRHFRALMSDPDFQMPASMPRPTERQLMTLEGRLDYMAKIGVTYIGLNHLNSSSYSGSDMFGASERNMGLTPQGREVIRAMDRAGIMLDVAHASHAAQRDIAAMVREGVYRLPLLVSHGVVSIDGDEPSWRETLPEVLEAVRATGGVIGVMFARQYIPNGTVADIVDQIDALKTMVGIDHIAFGSDADGFVGLPFATLDEGVRLVVQEMRRRGYTEEEIMKIRGGNYLHALARRGEILAGRRRRVAASVTSERALDPSYQAPQRTRGHALGSSFTPPVSPPEGAETPPPL